jgi:hypothetical protein
MFRRLAQLSEGQTTEGFDTIHGSYLNAQSYRYNTLLPNIIPTASSVPAPQALQSVVQSVNPWSGKTVDVHQNVNNLFQPNTIPDNLLQEAKTCSSGTLDELLASQDPSKPIRCGWVYTAPPPGSHLPTVSQGVLGTNSGPLSFANPPSNYQKWFWDLNDAKKQASIDTCKALKSCSDVNSEAFNGKCGYCIDLGQGIPIDSNGQPLYNDSSLTSCSPNSIITNTSNCPPSQVLPGSGLSVQTNTRCEPISGRLPFGCLESILQQAGCSPDGAIALALSSATPTDPMAGVRKLKSMSVYNKQANPQFNVDIFTQGQASQAVALQEFKNVATVAKSASQSSSLGASARDLCLQKGTIDSFDFCSEIKPSTPSPFALDCVQKVFLKAGGQPAGAMYPNPQNMASFYNLLPNWKAVLDYVSGLALQSKGVQNGTEGFVDLPATITNDVQAQASALYNLRGIRPEDLVLRAPFTSGTEVFWIDPTTSVLYENTIERFIPNFNTPGSILPQMSFKNKGTFMSLCDIRSQVNTQIKFKVVCDGGFIMTLNRELVKETPYDQDGYYASELNTSSAIYQNKNCWTFSNSKPNIMKVYWNNSVGSQQIFGLTAMDCLQMSAQFAPIVNISLTREINGPFIMFENTPKNGFADLRMTEVFAFNKWGNTTSNVQSLNDTDSKLKTPGKNGFLRFMSGSSNILMKQIGFNAWTAFTFVFRINVMPVNDFFLQMNMGGSVVQLYISPVNGSTCVINYNTNLGGANPTLGTKSGVQLQLGQWYMGVVYQNNRPCTSLTFSFLPLDQALTRSDMWFTTNVQNTSFTIGNKGLPIVLSNPSNSVYMFGASSNASVLQWDLAWWHFFNTNVRGTDMQRDAKNDWVLTL